MAPPFPPALRTHRARLPLAAMCLLVMGLMSACAIGPAARPANTLTAAERAAGWVMLFDGHSLSGWHGYHAPTPPPQWTVVDGALTTPGTPTPEALGGDLITDATFENFELVLEWRIARAGNSGVFFRVQEEGDKYPQDKYPWQSGLEYQLLDDANRAEPPLERTGSLFLLYAPTQDATRPSGQYNETRITVDHDHVEHWLNGVKVASYTIGSADFQARVAATKFRRYPGFAATARGHIGLQDHGDAVSFRSIRIRALP